MSKKKTNTGSDSKSLKLMRERGYYADNVNRFIHRPWANHGIRQDAFGFLDLLAFKAGVVGR